MKQWFRLFVLSLVGAFTIAFTAPDAEARRMGGGKSIGNQSGATFQRTPQRPPQNATAATGAGAQAAGTARRGGLMGPIAGLAAGLGLVALFSALGLGEELANFVMIALLVAAVAFAAMFILRRMRGASPAAVGAGAGGGSARFGGMPGGQSDSPSSGRRAFEIPPRDAVSAVSGTSARDSQAARDSGPVPGMGGGGPLPASDAFAAPDTGRPEGVPADFDIEGFERQAKVQFVRLQAVNDAGDLTDLREFTTPEMFAEIKLDIVQRGEAVNHTEVVKLDAQLLGIQTTPDRYIAGVRFWGLIREEAGQEPQPFTEIWTLSKSVSGGGWVLAGIQQADD